MNKQRIQPLAKGLVKRRSDEVVTPGTIVEDELLPKPKTTTYRFIGKSGEFFIIVLADVSTGEVTISGSRGPNFAKGLYCGEPTFLRFS